MASFTPSGAGAAFFSTLARYLPPPPPDAPSPLEWGDEAHVRTLFGEGVTFLDLRRRTYVERSSSREAYVELFRTTFGPIVGLRAR